MQKQKVIIVVGPTSSGKSAFAVEIAKKFNGEVVSADSRQIYRGLSIGTGKITKQEMRGVFHHLLDIYDPKKTYTAHDFIRDASRAIANIQSRGKLPIVCGGTGFYIDALVGRIELPEIPANPKLRSRLEKKDVPELFALLKKKDPKRVKTIDPHNKRRIIRALEIAASGASLKRSASRAKGNTSLQREESPYQRRYRRRRLDSVLWLGIRTDSDVLRRKIRSRLYTRMRRGMIAEVKRLHDAGLSWKRMDELGLEYRLTARYLKRDITKQELLTQLEAKIWQYAKRQRTYWKRNGDIGWLSGPDIKAAASRIKKFLAQ